MVQNGANIAAMPRVIRYFDKATESYAGEVILPEIPLEQLQHLFGVEAENPMYDSFLVGEREESFFQRFG